MFSLINVETDLVYLFRLLIAMISGAMVGLEREKRQKSAGLRTHIIVCMTSSLMVIVSKYGFMDVILIDGIQVDATRIAAGVVSAIGFLGAGVIYIKNDNQVGLTTAAGLWATVGIGVAFGAGLYFVGAVATMIVVIVQVVMHWRRLKVVSSAGGSISVNISRQNFTISALKERLEKDGIFMRNMTVTKNDSDELIVKASVVIAKSDSISSFVDGISCLEYIDTIEIYTIN